MQVHFLHRHVLDTVVILEEGNPPTHGAPNATCWSPTGTERQAPCHRSVRQGSGAEEAAASRGGAEVDLVEVLRGIQGAAGECNGLSLPGTGVDSGRL